MRKLALPFKEEKITYSCLIHVLTVPEPLSPVDVLHKPQLPQLVSSLVGLRVTQESMPTTFQNWPTLVQG